MISKCLTIASAALTALAVFTTPSRAQDDVACTLSNATLVCAESVRDGKTVLDAMSNPKSLELMIEAVKGPPVFSDGDQREAYRLSLEANRDAMTKFADREWRKYRRKKTSAEFYENIRAQYRAGMAVYREGLKLYRASTWYSPVKPYQSD